MTRSVALSLALAAAILLSASARATTIGWNPPTGGSGGTVTWATGTNWNGGAAPADDITTDTAQFNQTSYNFQPNAGTRSVAGIQIGDGVTSTANVTLTTTSTTAGLTIGAGGLTSNVNAGAFTLAAGSVIKLGASQTWTNNSSSSIGGTNTTSNISGVSGTPVTITFAGSGTGGFSLSNGLTDGAAGGTVSAVVDMANTTNGFVTFTRVGTFSGGLTVKSGTAYIGSTQTTMAGPIVLGDTALANTHDAFIGFDGASFTKDITVAAGSSGTLTLAMANSAGSPASANYSGNITLNNNLTLFAKRTANIFTVSGTITGSNTVTAMGLSATGSTVSVTGANGASFTGATNISTTVLSFANNGLGNAVTGQGNGKIVFTGNGGLQWAALNTQDISNKTIDSTGFTGTLDLGANNVTFATANGLTGSGNFTKYATSTGVLTLSAANNFSGIYTGSTAGNGATLLKDSNALQNATVTPNGTAIFDSTINSHAVTFGNLSGAGALALQDNAGTPVAVALTVGGNSGSPAAYSGNLTGSGSLIKVGSGALTLSGANSTFSGGLTIKAGTVIAGVANVGTVSGAAGPSTVAITLGDTGGSTSATLLTNFSVGSVTNAINLGTSTGTLTLGNASPGNTGTFAGAVTLGGSSTALTVSTFAGVVGSIAVSGGIGGTGNLIFNNAGTTSSESITSITSTGTITTQGVSTGTILLSNIGTAITGITHGSNGGLTVSAGTISSGNLTFSGTGIGIAQLPGVAISTPGTITNNGTTSGTTSLTGLISNSATVVTENSSTSALTLGGVSNSFAGGLNILQGTVNGAANANTFGASSNVITLGTASSSANATLKIASSQTYANPIATASNSTGVLTIGSTAGNPNFSGGITLNNSNLQFAFTAGSNSIISGNITGTGNIAINNTTNAGVTMGLTGGNINNNGTITNSVTGNGTTTIGGTLGSSVQKIIQNSSTSQLTLSGTNTSFVGSAEVNLGTLALGSTAALGSNNTVSVASGATFNINANNETIGGLNNISGSGGTVTNSGAAKILTIGGSGNYSFSGVITATTPANMAVTKTGNGTQTLGGANSYTGNTTVNLGTLLINGNSSGATGNMTVAATARLGGTGTLGGNVAVALGGILAGGDGTTGTTLTTGSAKTVTLNTGSIIELTLAASGAHSTLANNTGGTWAFDSAQHFTFNDLGATTGTYTGLITGLGADPGTTGGWHINNSGWTGNFTYDPGTLGGSVNLYLTVPEPSTWALLAFSLTTVMVLRRRRKD